jgi:hypothetical protein
MGNSRLAECTVRKNTWHADGDELASRTLSLYAYEEGRSYALVSCTVSRGVCRRLFGKCVLHILATDQCSGSELSKDLSYGILPTYKFNG